MALFGVLATASFFDMVMVYVKYIDQLSSCDLSEDNPECSKSKAAIFSDLVRSVLVVVFPNIGVKRAFYGMKVSNFECNNKLSKLEQLGMCFLNA